MPAKLGEESPLAQMQIHQLRIFAGACRRWFAEPAIHSETPVMCRISCRHTLGHAAVQGSARSGWTRKAGVVGGAVVIFIGAIPEG